LFFKKIEQKEAFVQQVFNKCSTSVKQKNSKAKAKTNTCSAIAEHLFRIASTNN